MIGAKLRWEGFEKTRFVAAESAAAPKLTKGSTGTTSQTPQASCP